MFEFDPNNLQKVKLGVHIAQSALIVVSWVLEIIVFRKAKSIDGRPGWYFGLCFLYIPALIYLTMTLRFPRTRKFAQPYALATVDFVFGFLSLSAFASQASYNSSGKCQGACGVSKVIVGLGVFIWICWVLTTIISLYGVMFWKREGYLPGASRAPLGASRMTDANDPDKEAFSTAPHDDEYVAVGGHGDEEHEIPAYGSRIGEAGPSRYDAHAGSSYDGGLGRVGGGYEPPSVSDEYTGYTGAGHVDDHDGRVRFPNARYDNV